METQTESKAEVLPASKSSMALAVVSKAIAEFDKVAAGIGELKTKFAGNIYEVAIPKGMTEAKAARMLIRQPRYDVERIRQAAKTPILQLGRDLDAEAKRITEEILAIEKPIDEQIKNEETRVENERQAKIAAEQKRIADIQTRIAAIRGIADGASLKTSAEVQDLIDRLQANVIDDGFAEFRADAQKAFDIASESLTTIHASRVAFEAEQERIRLERIELDRQKAEQVERDRVERERIAEEERIIKAARDAAAEQQAEELRLQRENQARLDEEARSRREAEERAHQEKMRLEREEDERKSAIVAETLRLQREENERIAAEQQQQREAIAAEEARLAAERERIAQEQAAPSPSITELKAATRAVEVIQNTIAQLTAEDKRPSNNEIVVAVAHYFVVDVATANKWLMEFAAVEQDVAA